MKGGYKLINMKNVNVTVGGSAVKIDGIYDSIEHNYRKPTIVTGLVIDSNERSDRWVNFRPSSDGGFSCEIGFNDSYVHLVMTVTSEDMVNIIEM